MDLGPINDGDRKSTFDLGTIDARAGDFDAIKNLRPLAILLVFLGKRRGGEKRGRAREQREANRA